MAGSQWRWIGRTRDGPTMGNVGVPDSFTDGSSRQRAIWRTTGRETGTVKSCSTFAQWTGRDQMSRMDLDRSFVPLGIAVLTVSDSRDLAADRSGDTLAERLQAAGHRLAGRAVVKDDVAAIRAAVGGFVADRTVDVVLTTGGTGFTGRDVTPEALEAMFTKRMDGFSTVFHRISFDKIGVSTIQSRATAGLVGTTFVFVLPGSPGACRDAWDGILAHQLDYRALPCNFVEIMPRLDEHLRRKPS